MLSSSRAQDFLEPVPVGEVSGTSLDAILGAIGIGVAGEPRKNGGSPPTSKAARKMKDLQHRRGSAHSGALEPRGLRNALWGQCAPSGRRRCRLIMFMTWAWATASGRPGHHRAHSRASPKPARRPQRGCSNPNATKDGRSAALDSQAGPEVPRRAYQRHLPRPPTRCRGSWDHGAQWPGRRRGHKA